MNRAPIQEFSLDELLNQTELWVDRNGLAVQIDTMTSDYRRNCAGFLLKYARDLAMITLHHQDSVLDVLELVSNPHAWMKDQPLYKRLVADGADPIRSPAA